MLASLINHLNWKLLIFVGILQVLKFEFLKFRILEIWDFHLCQGSHRLEKYLNIEGFLEKSLKTKFALKSTGESLQYLEKSLNFTIFCCTTLLC